MTSKCKQIAALSFAAVSLVGAGCGSDADSESASSPPDAAAGTTAEAGASAGQAKQKGVPKVLAENRAQANALLEEGTLDSKLAELEGHPIVVNQWASWCEPCRAELPYFRDAANSRADEVAFLGIDMQDDDASAEQFLEEVPLPFPSISDPNAAAIGSLGGGIVSPTTVFIDEKGEIVNVFQGSYASRDELEKDIDRHLTS